jgi:hypothetical protein
MSKWHRGNLIAAGCLGLMLLAASDATAECMPTSNATIVEADPFHVKVALSHSWVAVADTNVAVLAAALSGTPWYVQVSIDVSASAILLWIHLDDTGYGVFLTFYAFGGWVVQGADSICPPPPPPPPPPPAQCNGKCCEWGTKVINGKQVQVCTSCIPRNAVCP